MNRPRTETTGSRSRRGARALLLIALTALLAACGQGRDYGGQEATTTTSAAPVATPAPERFTSIGVGETHSCAVDEERRTWCWGANRYGQLGDGSTTPSTRPMLVEGGSAHRLVAPGTSHTCAVTTADGVECWGGNFTGKLGNGTIESSPRPVAVLGLPGPVAAIRSAADRSCAVLRDTSLWCWGQNAFGQIRTDLPAQLTRATEVIDAGVRDFAMRASLGCATTANGVECFGGNLRRRILEDVQVFEESSEPGAPTNLEQITVSQASACAIDAGEELVCWGALGAAGGAGANGGNAPWQTPRKLGLRGSMIAASGAAYCLILPDGGISCTGIRSLKSAPFQFQTGTEPSITWRVEGLESRAVQVVGGLAHFCALTENGKVHCWGWNEDGQLGDGTRINNENTVKVN